MTVRRLEDDGTSLLASDLTAVATSIPVSDAQWTTAAGDYPLDLLIGGELVTATGISTAGTQTFTGVTRSVNGVAKAHAAGTPVRVARAMRLSLGHAVSAPGALTGSTPVTPPAETPEIPTTDLVLWLDAGVDPAAGNLADGEPYTAELGSTSGADAQDPTVGVAASVAVWDPDGVDDHIDTDYTPSFTPTTGALTVVVIGVFAAADDTTNFPRALSAESASSNGINLTYGGAGLSELWSTVGGATTLAAATYDEADLAGAGAALSDGDRFMVVATVDAGELRIYHPALGLSAPADITGVGTITPSTIRAFRPTLDAIADRAAASPMQALLVYERVITPGEMDAIAEVYGLLGGGASGNSFVTQEPLPTLAPTGSGILREVDDVTEWNAAAAAANPGDLIVITTPITSTSGLNWTTRSGTAANPIVITSADPDTAHVIGNVGGDGSDPAGVDVEDVTHVHVRGLRTLGLHYSVRYRNVQGADGAPCKISHITAENTHYASLVVQQDGAGNDCSYIDIEDCTAFGNSGSEVAISEGIYIGSGSGTPWTDTTHHVNVRRCEVHSKQSEAVDVKPGPTDIVIEHCYFHDIDLAALGPTGIITLVVPSDSPTSGETDVRVICRGCRIHDVTTQGHGAISYGFAGIDIYGNLIWNYSHAGIRRRSFAAWSDGTPDSNFIEDNTCIGLGNQEAGIGSGTPDIVYTGNVDDGTALVGTAFTYNAGTDFVGPTTGTAIATGFSAGMAGAGSGFMLTDASAANGTGDAVEASPMVIQPGQANHIGAMPAVTVT